MLALAWIISSVRNLNSIVQLLLLQLVGTDSSGSSSLSGVESGMGQEKLFARRFHGCPWVSAPLRSTPGAGGEKAVVTVGFTAPAPSISHWAPTTSPMSYLILTRGSQLLATALSQDQSHPIPSLLFGFSSSLSPVEILVFLSYLVIPRHPPDSSSGLTIAAISSPLA